jgi:MFS transporter, PPP family, 3-phenylpropionic acid transporter
LLTFRPLEIDDTMHSQPDTRSALRRIVAIHFLTFAARGLVLPFANIYLKSVGFSGTEIGLLVGISALVQLVLTPILNTVADRTGRHRQLFYGFSIGNISALLGIVASTNKLWLSSAILLRSSSDKPTEPLLSQLTITWLARQKRKIYGRLRAWGSFGWGAATLFSGRIIAIGGYPLLFLISALLNLAALPLIRALPARTAEQHDRPSGSVPRRPGFYILLASLFLYFMGQSAIYTFLFIFFQDDLGASNQMIGILASVAALSEIPSMLFIDALLRRVNIHTTLTAGLLGMCMLWVAFAQLTDATLLIPLMIIRGTFYTLQAVSITLLIARISHPVNVATNQSLALVTIPGLAVLLTGPLSGWIFDHLGTRILFEFAGVIGACAILLLIVGKRHLVAQPEVSDSAVGTT